MEKRILKIDYMYIDLDTCDRCIETDKNLDEAIEAVSNILKETGVEVIVNKIHVQTEEQAIKLGFVSSPTIRINGKDIQINGKETFCESCSDICGDEMDCRVWTYQGKDYDVVPKGMVIEAMLKAIYGNAEESNKDTHKNVKEVPENLKKFFTSVKGSKIKNIKSSCCSSDNSCTSGCCD